MGLSHSADDKKPAREIISLRKDILIHQVTAQISAQRLSGHCSIKIRFTYYHATTSLIVLMVHNDILI